MYLGIYMNTCIYMHCATYIYDHCPDFSRFECSMCFPSPAFFVHTNAFRNEVNPQFFKML